MQNNPDVVQRAKRYVKRYRLCRAIMTFCILLGVYAMIHFWDNVLATLVALAVVSLMALIGGRVGFKKCILSVLNKELDADAYLATVCQGRFDGPSATCQLYGEYFCGNYQSVVSICKMKLDDPKTAKRYTCYYLSYLAGVYFDIGDDENLRKVCEQYKIAWETASRRKQAIYRRRLHRMPFYELYLKQDVDACMAWIHSPSPNALIQHQRTFYQARLAIVQGNTEEANRYYEALAKEIPQLNYGKLAANALAAQEDQALGDRSRTFEISDESTEVTLYPAKYYTLRKVIGMSIIVFALTLSVLGILGVLGWQNRYEREMEAYRESIRVLVAQDYDNVVMLDTFDLKNGEEIVDVMFICKTDTEVMVGCVYVYSGQTNLYYERMTGMPVASLSKGSSPLLICSFPSRLSPNQIESSFYTIEADIPAEYCHLSTFEVNGQKVYYVVTEIVPLP